MHPPRSNSAYQANQFGDQNGGSAQAPQDQAATRPAGADQVAANQIEGREEQPVWQTAFVLGPNVRFTRTPDRVAAKPETVEAMTAPAVAPAAPQVSRGQVAQPQAAAATTRVPQAPVPTAHTPRVNPQADQRPASPYGLPRTGAPQQPVPASARAPIPTQPLQQQQQPRVPASVTLPQPPDAVGARALTYKLRRELARQQAEQAAWEASMAEDPTRPVAPPPVATQPAPLVQGMRTVMATTTSATVGHAAAAPGAAGPMAGGYAAAGHAASAQAPAGQAVSGRPVLPSHMSTQVSSVSASATVAPAASGPGPAPASVARPTMARNAFLRGPVQPQQPGQPQTAAATAPVAQPAAAAIPTVTQPLTGYAQPGVTQNSVRPQAPVASRSAAPPAAAGAPPTARLPISALLSDHIFFEAMIDPVDAPVETEMARAVPVNPQPSAMAPAPVAPAAPVTIPGRSPAVRAEVVRYRPDALATAMPAVASLPKPVFDAPAGSVVALYREVARRDVVADQAVAIIPAAGAPEGGAAIPEPSASAPARSVIPTSSASARQPLFRAQEAMGEGEYELPYLDFLQQPPVQTGITMTAEALEQSAGLLESVLEDFGIKGEVIDVRPGPVVTLYEFEPAPGVKSSRVIGLSDDIARSMSALSARVAVVPGRNVIGIELPNPVRETVYLRELIETPDYAETRYKLPVCLGKTIGGEPVIAELAKMPHLLVAGTTGSGKSVAINTMILSLLYRFRPDECRLIMVDPKMLELSVYDGIPHLLTPVVTDPKKAVMALKWAVREMEDRYRKMSRLGVRNIDGYNARAAQAREKGETITVSVQTGFDRQSGEIVYEEQELDLSPMPYIVVVVDEMADLMMVAGKEIEGAIQRLAQMARAAGIHLIMATQRPSVDVITGTIKANFPTRVSFQVTSKIDSRTILGEPGAEHLLGQGDMLHMVGGGRIARVHGPFVSDEEVEKVVAHLKMQARPDYLGTVTEDADEAEDEPEEDVAVFDKSAIGEEDGNDLYDKAVKVVLRDKKCSTSYIQRRLSIGYNKAASLVERMEQEGIVGAANHVGKRAIIVGGREVSAEGDFEG
ncbi:cell division protein FtsK [Rhizobium sp. Root274]|uniref:DNA translocase FtsK n=1 Tax=unclassified Rhizobium TaxID=2613769 RepID=UPI0007144C5A|nr:MULTISPECIES: DNA translocase FtsK [unclassified Rhizobium]KQW32072.1 cell division protein FtsK [Rhizobium sp. Root1240]KRD33609.1 cell division protein FtsK [Rhizobium sp. Root274]